MVRWLNIIILAPALLALSQASIAQPNATLPLDKDFNPISASSTSVTPTIDIDDPADEAVTQKDIASQTDTSTEEDINL